jgi:hypothetical protein
MAIAAAAAVTAMVQRPIVLMVRRRRRPTRGVLDANMFSFSLPVVEHHGR